jgi:hypothetical protein
VKTIDAADLCCDDILYGFLRLPNLYNTLPSGPAHGLTIQVVTSSNDQNM